MQEVPAWSGTGFPIAKPQIPSLLPNCIVMKMPQKKGHYQSTSVSSPFPEVVKILHMLLSKLPVIKRPYTLTLANPWSASFMITTRTNFQPLTFVLDSIFFYFMNLVKVLYGPGNFMAHCEMNGLPNCYLHPCNCP